MLNVIDSFARWTDDIIESLYIDNSGEVDKPFPAPGDILGIYLMENRLYPSSPQGWFIVTARKLRRNGPSPKADFWCLSLFNADIPPIPDIAVPWHGEVDVWKMRDRLTDRSVWIRLRSHEMDGCSYYNLSDWIKAKRELNEHRSLKRQPTSKPGVLKATKPLKKHLKETPIKRRTTKARRMNDEYVHASDSDSESNSSGSETNEPDSPDVEFAIPMFPMLTTGKMSSGNLDSVTTTVATTPKLKSYNAQIGSDSDEEDQIDASDPSWIPLRDDTQQTVLSMLASKVPEAFDQSWLVDLSRRLEKEAIFTKSDRNQDRYEGISRAVKGIINRFDCLADAVEMLIPIENDTRDKLKKIRWNDTSPAGIDFDPYTH